MQVQVNGEMLELRDGITLTELIAQLALGEKRIAVELNLEIIPRSEHESTVLKAADRVEIVHAIGGG